MYRCVPSGYNLERIDCLNIRLVDCVLYVRSLSLSLSLSLSPTPIQLSELKNAVLGNRRTLDEIQALVTASLRNAPSSVGSGYLAVL